MTTLRRDPEPRAGTRFTRIELREWHAVIATVTTAPDLARQQVRLVSALRLGAITVPDATDLRRAIARRIGELRATL